MVKTFTITAAANRKSSPWARTVVSTLTIIIPLSVNIAFSKAPLSRSVSDAGKPNFQSYLTQLTSDRLSPKACLLFLLSYHIWAIMPWVPRESCQQGALICTIRPHSKATLERPGCALVWPNHRFVMAISCSDAWADLWAHYYQQWKNYQKFPSSSSPLSAHGCMFPTSC